MQFSNLYLCGPHSYPAAGNSGGIFLSPAPLLSFGASNKALYRAGTQWVVRPQTPLEMGFRCSDLLPGPPPSKSQRRDPTSGSGGLGLRDGSAPRQL